MTVRDWLTASSRLAGAIGKGDPLGPDDAADAMLIATQMLDAWAADRLTIFSQTRTLNPIVANQQRYTIGAGGDWTQDRPLWIDGAGILTADGLEFQMRVFPLTQWQAIGLKGVTTSNRPGGLYYNPVQPLGQIDLYPIPTDNTAQVVLYTPHAALKSVTSLDTVLSLPEGWARALRYNLAQEIITELKLPADPGVLSGAISSYATISRVNEGLLDEMAIDRALVSQRGDWSIHAGDFRRGF